LIRPVEVLKKLGGESKNMLAYRLGLNRLSTGNHLQPCNPSENVIPAQKDWTVLYYMAGNNNISGDLVRKTARLEKSGSDDNLNILVQLAQPEKSPYPGVGRYKMEKNPQPVKSSMKNFCNLMAEKITGRDHLPEIASPSLENLGAVPMNTANTLSNFVTWGMKNYPAKHYCLVIMDHGYGFAGTVEDQALPHKLLSLPDLKRALSTAQKETGEKLDILGFDACLMQQAEVAYQLKDQADFLLASQEVEYPRGMPEGKMFKSLAKELKKGDVNPEKAGRLMAKEAEIDSKAMKTISLLDLKQMEQVKQTTDHLAQSLLKSHISSQELKKIISHTYNFCRVEPGDKLCNEYRDLYHFAELLSLNSGVEPEVKKAALEVMQSIKSAVIQEGHQGKGDINGLAIYLPKDGMLNYYDGRNTESKVAVNVPAVYRSTDWARETKWDEWLGSLNKK